MGFDISLTPVLSLVRSPWWLAFNAFVSGGMLWFVAATLASGEDQNDTRRSPASDRLV